MLCPECRFDVRPTSEQDNPYQEARALSIHLHRDHGIVRSVEALVAVRETLKALREMLPVVETMTVNVDTPSLYHGHDPWGEISVPAVLLPVVLQGREPLILETRTAPTATLWLTAWAATTGSESGGSYAGGLAR